MFPQVQLVVLNGIVPVLPHIFHAPASRVNDPLTCCALVDFHVYCASVHPTTCTSVPPLTVNVAVGSGMITGATVEVVGVVVVGVVATAGLTGGICDRAATTVIFTVLVDDWLVVVFFAVKVTR